MGPSTLQRGRSSPLRQSVLGVVIVLVLVSGVFAMLVVSGHIELPFLRKVVATGAPNKARPEGVAVPLAARPIPAFTEIAREHVVDLKTMEFTVAYFSAEQVAQNGLLPFDKIMGRVLKTDHDPGYAFTEKNFLPKGTRPGLVAGVPAGKRSFILQADTVMGIRGLRIGDHVDLLATMEIDLAKGLDRHRGPGGMSPGLMDAQTTPTNLPRQAGVKALVQNAVVVSPASARQVPVPGSPVGPDGKPKMRTSEEVMIAVDPREVAPLTEALAVHAAVFCVAHSGAPDEDQSTTPGSMPPPRIKVIETIVGGKRDVLVFPAYGKPEPKQPPEKMDAPKDKTPTPPETPYDE